MRKVNDFVGTFHCDVQRFSTVGLMLLNLDPFGCHFALEGVDRGLVWSEVKQANLAVRAALGQATNDSPREVAAAVYHYQLHSL